MSFAANIIKTSTTPIHYIWGEDANGEPHHWFIMCSSQKYQMLKIQFGNGTRLEDYGIIIASGPGKNPSSETKAMLKENTVMTQIR